jgi:hypothetical protein
MSIYLKIYGGIIMREDIKQIYLADRWTYNDIDYDESDDNRKYYVYEWHTSNGKIFYVLINKI